MKVLSLIIPMMFLVVSATADKRVRPFSFQRQTASSSAKPPASESGPYPPSDWKPEKPQTSTEPAPYPPSGWKPDGPQLEVGPPPPKPDDGSSSTPAPDSETNSPAPNTPNNAPAKFVSFERPENTVYFVLPDGKLQQLIIAPQSAPLVARAPFRQVGFTRARPLKLQLVDSHIVEIDPLQDPAFSAFNGPLVRVTRKV